MVDIVCLVIWIYLLIKGIYCCVKHKEVNKVVYICAVLIAIMHYLGRIIH